MSRKCKLCGGRLNEGICTECGLDNRKTDEMYQDILNKSSCDGENMTHIHELHDQGKRVHTYDDQRKHVQGSASYGGNRAADHERPPKKPVSKSEQNDRNQSQRRVQNYRPVQFTSGRSSYDQTKRKGRTVLVLVIGIFVLMLVLAVAAEKMSTEYGLQEQLEMFDDPDLSLDLGDGLDDPIYDPYGNVQDTLRETGEYWEQQVGSGMYQVGVDIPEGEYKVSGSQGSSFEVHDLSNYITDAVWFGEEEGKVDTAEGVKLFAGAMICVDGMEPVTFISENAQTQELQERMKNPLTESVEIEGTMVAGKDFPAGTYDIKVKTEDSFGVVYYEIPAREEGGYAPSFSVMMEAEPTEEYPEYCSQYKNVVLPQGATIETEDFVVELVPSQGIVSEDYQSFYDNM